MNQMKNVIQDVDWKLITYILICWTSELPGIVSWKKIGSHFRNQCNISHEDRSWNPTRNRFLTHFDSQENVNYFVYSMFLASVSIQIASSLPDFSHGTRSSFGVGFIEKVGSSWKHLLCESLSSEEMGIDWKWYLNAYENWVEYVRSDKLPQPDCPSKVKNLIWQPLNRNVKLSPRILWQAEREEFWTLNYQYINHLRVNWFTHFLSFEYLSYC